MLLLLALSAPPVNLTAEIKRAVAQQECGPPDESNEEIVVCARRREQQRYRVGQEFSPVELERQPPNSVRERAKWIEEGDSGTGSCSSVGPGGWTGCMQKSWKKARQQKKGWYGL